MDSFYGGQPGISFIIVERYDSIKNMLDAFSQGGAYEKVKYGEYVIIDTIMNLNNKRSLENGLIFCRGFNYQEDRAKVPNIDDYDDQNSYELAMRKYFQKPGAGAIYVGQIVGPQGEAPYLEFLSESAVKKLEDRYKGTGKLDIVSGKTHNEITYAYCNIRDEDGNVTGCALGFTIPYHVIEIDGESISPYDPAVGEYDAYQDKWDYTNLIQKQEGNTDDRPFYSLWKLKVPKGIHGADLSAIGIDDEDQQYYYEVKNYNEVEEGKVTRYKMGFYNKVIGSITFDDATSEFVITYSTGAVDRIKARFLYDISIDEETNQLKVTYSDLEDGHRAFKLIGKPIKFIDRVEYDETTQKIIVYYNTKGEDGLPEKDIIEKQIRVIDRIEYDKVTQKLIVYYNTYTGEEQDKDTIDKQFKVIESIDLDENKKLNIHYNTGEVDVISDRIKVIEKVDLDTNKRLNIHYNTTDENGEKEIDIIPDKIRFIDDIIMNKDNKIEIIYNTKNDDTQEQEKEILGYAFKFLSDIKINNMTQKVEVTYIVGQEDGGEPKYQTEEIGSALNFIQEIIINQNYHLLVLYSDPVMRAAAITAGKAATYDDHEGVSHDDWWDLGLIRGESGGVHIIGDVSSVDDLPPDGPPEGYHGWIYTVTEKESSPILYAYDYDKKKWYPIGSLDSSLTKPKTVLIISEADETGIAPLHDGGLLNIDGYWLILKKDGA